MWKRDMAGPMEYSLKLDEGLMFDIFSSVLFDSIKKRIKPKSMLTAERIKIDLYFENITMILHELLLTILSPLNK